MAFPTYDSADKIPEGFKDDYEEKDGKWVPKVPEDKSADVTRLTEALRKERELKDTAAREAREAKEALEMKKRTDEARDKGVSEEELKKIRDAEEAARKPIVDERDRLAAENRQLKLTDKTKKLYLDHGGMTDRLEEAMFTIERRTDLGDKDGIIYKDKDGNVTAMDAEKFFMALAVEKPFLFSGTGASGSGSDGDSNNPDTVPAANQDTKNRLAANVHGAF